MSSLLLPRNLTKLLYRECLLHLPGFQKVLLLLSGRRVAPQKISKLINSSSIDQVCGSAHCLLTPYWATKRAVSMSSSERTKQLEAPMNARQASQRGGELLTHWDTKAGKITLSGKSVVWGEGNLVL